jgi:hypothetical protein
VDAAAARMSGPSKGDAVATFERDGVVYVALLPRGPIAVLDGTAAVIWRASSTGPLESTADRVAHTMGWDAGEIRESVDSFVGGLVAQGLIAG